MVKLGVIGLGGWGKNHVRVLSELGVLVAVCDRNKDKALLYSSKYNVKGYDSFEAMLSEEQLDAAVICTSTSTHYSLTHHSLTSGLATFVEKPMTYSSGEGEELVELAENNGLILTVGFIERFNPAVARLKEILKKGKMGEPLLLEFHRESKWAGNISNMGIVGDTSIHDIDTARWIFEDEPNVVFSRTGRVMSDHEDFATIILGFKGQKTAFIASNWVTPKKVRQLTTVCTEAIITVDFITQELKIDDGEKTLIPRHAWQEPLMLELKSFVECVKNGGRTLVTGRDGVKNTKIAEATLASSARNAPVFLEL